MKRYITAAMAACFILLAGCAGDQAFIKAQADAAVAAGNARVAEAQAKEQEARAIIAVASKLDAGGAAAYVLGLTLRNAGGTKTEITQVAVQRPRDFLDYLQAFTQAIGTVGNIAVPIVTIKEQSRTARAGYDRDARIESVRQAGEASRIASVAGIAAAVAERTPPNIITTTTLSGQGVIGDGMYVGPTTTTRTCNGGTAAHGGNGGNGTTTGGAGAAGGSAAGGIC